MLKMLIPLAAMTAWTCAAQAQSTVSPQPAPPSAATPAPGDAAKPTDAAKSGDGGGQTGVGDTANQQTYKMKDGGMYQPPAQRPESPAMDTKTYGRT